MSDRLDEVKGSLKEGFGKLTGNNDLEAEGRAQQDIARGQRKAKGVANQIKGNVEEGIGKMTGDESTRAQGTADRIKGETQRTD